jgi:LAO/AO transport system kinase
VLSFINATKKSGVHERRRSEQNVGWMHDLVEELLRERFLSFPGIQERLERLEDQVGRGTHSPTLAALELMKSFRT